MAAVSNEMILQAITELSKITVTLSNDMVEVNSRIDYNQKKTDRIHNFYMLQGEDIMEVRADVKEIKRVL